MAQMRFRDTFSGVWGGAMGFVRMVVTFRTLELGLDGARRPFLGLGPLLMSMRR